MQHAVCMQAWLWKTMQCIDAAHLSRAKHVVLYEATMPARPLKTRKRSRVIMQRQQLDRPGQHSHLLRICLHSANFVTYDIAQESEIDTAIETMLRGAMN